MRACASVVSSLALSPLSFSLALSRSLSRSLALSLSLYIYIYIHTSFYLSLGFGIEGNQEIRRVHQARPSLKPGVPNTPPPYHR